ncbi:hypothetical protein EAD98_06600, partial [Micromonospora sp. CV4]
MESDQDEPETDRQPTEATDDRSAAAGEASSSAPTGAESDPSTPGAEPASDDRTTDPHATVEPAVVTPAPTSQSRPVSAPPAQPVSAPPAEPVTGDRDAWTDDVVTDPDPAVGSTRMDTLGPVSAPPASPVSAPPAYPVSAPPAYPVSAPPAYPVSETDLDVSGSRDAPAYDEPDSWTADRLDEPETPDRPTSAEPVSAPLERPVSAPPARDSGPAERDPVDEVRSAPDEPPLDALGDRSTGEPTAGSQADDVSGADLSARPTPSDDPDQLVTPELAEPEPAEPDPAAPVSAAPISAPPISAPPVSAAPIS